MNATQLLAELRARDVVLWIEGEALRYTGPEDVLTPRVLAAAKAHKPALRELLLLEAQATATPAEPPFERDGVSLSAEGNPEPQVLEAASTWGGREAQRPDLCTPLGLPALDEDPPEPCPHPRFVWARDLGVWMDGAVVVSTVATSARRDLFYAACRARRTLEAAAATVGQAPDPREVYELAVEMVAVAEEEKAWRAARRSRRELPQEFDAGEAYRAQNPKNTEVPQVLVEVEK